MPSAEQQREGNRLRVEDAMGPARPVLSARTSVRVALELMRRDGDPYRLVKTGHGQWTWAGLADLEAAAAAGQGEGPLEQVLSRGPAPRLYPDVALDNALRLVGDHPVLPVSSRANVNQLLGSITLADIHRAYGIGTSTGSAPSG